MAQCLKSDVRQSIISAALEVFARQGYPNATMANIGQEAVVSTGNIYRYFTNKQALFDAAVPSWLGSQLADLTGRKVRALDGIADLQLLDSASPYRMLSDELLEFCINNRLGVVILLGKAQGTVYESFAASMIQHLSTLAMAHAKSVQPDYCPSKVDSFALELIYRNLVQSLVSILGSSLDADAVRRAMNGYSRYHLAGLKSFFAEIGRPASFPV